MNNHLSISKTRPKELTNKASIKEMKLHENDEWTLYEVKPDKMPIAIYEKMNDFNNHRFQLQKGDRIYMFSDGYVDQFGGPKGKKFLSKPFKRLLLKHPRLEMEEQKIILDQTIMAWMETSHQIDDISIMGIEI